MDYQQLFIKYLGGNISREELPKLLEYLESKPTKELEQITEELWYSNDHKNLPNPHELLSEINHKIKDSRSKVVYFTPMRIAAAILLTILSAAILFIYTMPGKENAITVNEIIKINPPGQKSKIYLPDGSIVMLNSGSSIVYPEFFTDSLRKVVLEGEAFFEVRSNAAKPFQVYSQGIVTTALGTSFNIKAYAGDEDVIVALATGQVSVHREEHGSRGEEIFLEPGSAAVYNQSIDQFSMRDYEYNKIIGWKDGIIVFENASQKEVFNTLSRWYGIEIIEENTSKDVGWSYSSQFKNEYLENILESIGFSKDFTYRINNKVVTIKYQ